MKHIIADECDRLLTELRATGHHSLFSDIEQQLFQLKRTIWSKDIKDFQISSILSPFQLIITSMHTTDVLTSLSLASVQTFIVHGIVTENEDALNLIECICTCQFQSTSEHEVMRVSEQILNCIISICSLEFDIKGLKSLLTYCIQEISQQAISILLIDAFSVVLHTIFKSKNQELCHQSLIALFFLADVTQPYTTESIRHLAIINLLNISRYKEIQDLQILLSICCVLLHQQLSFTDIRDNFVLILRIFFTLFQERYINYPFMFSNCFELLLNFIMKPPVSVLMKAAALEVISDFVEQPNFVNLLYANFNERKSFPPLFNQLVATIVSISSARSINQPLASAIISSLFSHIQSCNESKETINFNQENLEYSRLLDFSAAFNESPTSYASNRLYNSRQLAKMLMISPNLSTHSIGEFFGKNSQFCNECLNSFLALFDFSSLDFDSAIRLFLSSFKIVGEGQIVDRIFECFSKTYYQTHQNQGYANQEAVHVLAYGWLMLHTSFHNNNVVKKPVFEEFCSMLEKQNGGENFDKDLLNYIFNSIKRAKIPYEESKQTDSIAYWILLLEKQRNSQLKIVQDLNDPKGLFVALWNAAGTNMMSESSPYLDKCAEIASQYDIYSVLDDLMNFHVNLVIADLENERTLNGLQFIANLVHKYGDKLRKGWREYAHLMIVLFQLDLISEEFPFIFEDKRMIKLSYKMLNQTKKRRNSSSMFGLFRRSDSSDSDITVKASVQSEMRETVQNTLVDQFDTSSYNQESLIALIQAFDQESETLETKPEVNSIYISYCIMKMTKIMLKEGERFPVILDSKRFTRYTTPNLMSNPVINTVIINNIFLLLDELWEIKELKENLMQIFDLFSNLPQNMMQDHFNKIYKGLNIFFENHLESFALYFNWMCVIKILLFGYLGVKDETCYELFRKLTKITDKRPGKERFYQYHLPLIDATASICLNSEDFSELESLLGSIGELEPNMWRDAFDSVFFPVLTYLGTKSRGRKQVLDMTILVMHTFLTNIQQIMKLALFEPMWFRLLSLTLDLMRNPTDDIKTSLPILLKEALDTMKVSGAFESQKTLKTWELTQKSIKNYFPDVINDFLANQ